ncbi:MAG: ATP-binding protein [Pseudomonadota bacterium]|nr:ATP-binding protein [Pseudomonadota bacterium]HJO35893.1 ATP-binding protein [Gammaproteobacteria bacterium]
MAALAAPVLPTRLPPVLALAPPSPWRALWLLEAFRVGWALMLLTLSALPGEEVARPLPDAAALVVVAGYLLLAAGVVPFLLARRPSARRQIPYHVFADVLLLTLILQLTGGLRDGLGLIVLLPVAITGLYLPPRACAAVAAAATGLILLGELTGATLAARAPAYPQAGLLGAFCFFAALGTSLLTHRLQHAAALAAERSRELAELGRLNEAVVRQLPDGLLVLDAEDRVRLMNPRAAELLGLHDLHGARNAQDLPPALGAVLGQWRRQPAAVAEPLRLADGRDVEASFNALPLSSGNGTIVQLEDAHKNLQRSQQMKLSALGRLTASIAHEIRNPLGAMLHAAQLLAETAPPEEAELVAILTRHGQRIDQIIGDIMSLSRTRPSAAEAIELSAWLTAFAAQFQAEHPGSYQLSVAGDPVGAVRMDPGHLRQVLANLLENALHHAGRPDEPLVLRLTTRRREHAGGLLHELEIADNGCGIAVGIAGQIFEPFFTTSHRGSGLGLFIARGLCEFNDARLALVPSDGEGTTFRLTFAAAPAAASGSQP